jgi:HD-GYP domain-containing protein (c-di-GMP phosphodiesterase class II)
VDDEAEPDLEGELRHSRVLRTLDVVGPRSNAGPDGPPPGPRRTAEALAALTAALDAAEHRGDAFAVRAALAAIRLGTDLGLSDEMRSELLYAGLLRDAGTCGRIEWDGGSPTVERVAHATHRTGLLGRRPARPAVTSHLDRAPRAGIVCRLLGMPVGVSDAVVSAQERWDGRGPLGQRGASIPQCARILAAATVIAAEAPSGGEAIERALKRARGRELEPDLADRAIKVGREGLWRELNGAGLLERLLEMEPASLVRTCDDGALDTLAATFADIVDTRTPRMGRHGRRVAVFADRTAAELALPDRLRADLRRAAHLHDLGKLLVPVSVLEKPAELSVAERRIVDEHARAGAGILARSRAFARLSPLVVGHHERLDGTGALPAFEDDALAFAARAIALADRYEAMTAERPYRPLLSTAQVWTILEEVATEGRASFVLRGMRRAIWDA